MVQGREDPGLVALERERETWCSRVPSVDFPEKGRCQGLRRPGPALRRRAGDGGRSPGPPAPPPPALLLLRPGATGLCPAGRQRVHLSLPQPPAGGRRADAPAPRVGRGASPAAAARVWRWGREPEPWVLMSPLGCGARERGCSWSLRYAAGSGAGAQGGVHASREEEKGPPWGAGRRVCRPARGLTPRRV